MPILDVEIVSPGSGTPPQGVATKLANAAAKVCESKPGELWVRVRTLLSDHYAECGGGPPPGVTPVFVSVLMYQQPAVEKRKEIASELATHFAPILDRPSESIHVLFEPEGRERVAFGGKLRT